MVLADMHPLVKASAVMSFTRWMASLPSPYNVLPKTSDDTRSVSAPHGRVRGVRIVGDHPLVVGVSRV